jgi:hypothetical protein
MPLFQQPPAPAPAAPPAPAPVPAPPAPVPTPPAAPPPTDLGFPANTPLEQMTVEQREAYWKHHARRHEQAYKDANIADLQRQAQELAALKAATQTDQEKAVESARAEGRTQALREAATALVDAHFAAATPGLSPQDRQDLLAGIDRTYFLAADGITVDTAKVTSYAARIAPAATATPPAAPGATPPRPDMGQGRFAPTARPSGMEAGRELARKRFASQTPPANPAA